MVKQLVAVKGRDDGDGNRKGTVELKRTFAELFAC